MKYTLLVLIVIYCIYRMHSPVLAAVTWGSPNPQRKPGGCYDEDTGHLTGGEQITVSGKCVRARCSSDGTIEYHSCSTVGVPENSRCRIIPEDLSKAYPECCRRIVCNSVDK